MNTDVWQLRDRKNNIVKPYRYSNGKSQEDAVRELITAIEDSKDDTPIIFIGSCNSGKSAIALNVINHFNKGIIVTPTVILEKQYENSYCDGKYNIGSPDDLLDVKQVKGRTHFQCTLIKDVNCGNGMLPCVKKPTKNKDGTTPSRAEFTSPLCKYWSPICNSRYSINYDEFLTYHQKYMYDGITGIVFFYKAKKMCPYYSQFMNYTKDRIALIYNQKKWEIETWMGVKPKVDVEIIDEGDDVLDNICFKLTIDRKVFINLKDDKIPNEVLNPIINSFENVLSKRSVESVNEFIDILISKLTGNVEGSNIGNDILSKLQLKEDYKSEYECELNGNESITIFVPRPDIILKEFIKRSGKLVFMSATMQSIDILKKLYNIDPIVIYAEKEFVGTLNIKINGKEKDINYNSWDKVRDKCISNLYGIIDIAKDPILISAHATKYLPFDLFKLNNLESSVFRGKKIMVRTNFDRGVDLPDDECRTVIILKYPLVPINDPVIKSLQKRLGGDFREYYNDRADRNLVQQVSRGVRHKNDWCDFYTLDVNALNSVIRSGWNKD
jgi:hypothetical protein